MERLEHLGAIGRCCKWHLCIYREKTFVFSSLKNVTDDFFYLQEINVAVRNVCVVAHNTYRRVGLCIVVIIHRVYSKAKTEIACTQSVGTIHSIYEQSWYLEPMPWWGGIVKTRVETHNGAKRCPTGRTHQIVRTQQIDLWKTSRLYKCRHLRLWKREEGGGGVQIQWRSFNAESL